MSSLSQAATAAEKRTNARYWIVVMLFIVTSFNYGDRATLSIAGSEMARDIGLDPVGMGYVFSAFSWAYVIGQIPGGWLLDRFGSKRVYFWSIFIWSMFTLLQGFVDIFSGFGIIVALFTLRFLVGLAESPSFPGNSRIVAAWFPAQERGTAVSIFNSAQYFATVIFAPIMGWLTHEVGWSHVFFFMGGLGIVISFVWLKVIHDPNNHPGVNQKELDYIAEGGALINMDQKSSAQKVPFSVKKGADQATDRLADDDRHLYRSVLHQRLNLLLYHMVPGLSGAGARHVDPQSRLCRLDSGGVRLCRRGAGRGDLRLVNAPHRLAEHCAQNADCAGDAALHDHVDV